jgi:hypothetical protein
MTTGDVAVIAWQVADAPLQLYVYMAPRPGSPTATTAPLQKERRGMGFGEGASQESCDSPTQALPLAPAGELASRQHS